MSKGTNQKLKLYYLYKILMEKTDAEHIITMQQIISELAKHEVSAERKSVYDDIDNLDKMGIVVESVRKDGEYGYYVKDRLFDVAEMKLLVDAIQSSKFITESKTNELIKKLETFVSHHDARQLHRQVFVRGRVKTMNEEAFKLVDTIHSAIGNNHKITFQYCNWNEKKQMVPKHSGKYYVVSPWALTWDDENYYLIAHEDEAGKIKHYRVDKMMNLSEMSEKRVADDSMEHFNLADYAKMNFGMFGGSEKDVQLTFDNEKAGIIIDRFGKEVMIRPDKNGRSVAWVKVAVSPQFIGWIFSLGDGVKITAPTEVVDMAKAEIKRLVSMYE